MRSYRKIEGETRSVRVLIIESNSVIEIKVRDNKVRVNKEIKSIIYRDFNHIYLYIFYLVKTNFKKSNCYRFNP